MSQPCAILLDIDNTVYPYSTCHRAGVRAAAAAAALLLPAWEDAAVFEADYTWARAEVKRTVGVSAVAHCRLHYFKRMVEQRWGRVVFAPIEALNKAYWDGYRTGLIADEGCVACLTAWRDAGIRLGWVTNFTTERQLWKLRLLNLEPWVDVLVSSEEAGEEKPGLRPFQLALERLDASPSQTWMIGDEWTSDIAPARALGMTALWRVAETERPRGRENEPTFTWLELARDPFLLPQRKAA